MSPAIRTDAMGSLSVGGNPSPANKTSATMAKPEHPFNCVVYASGGRRVLKTVRLHDRPTMLVDLLRPLGSIWEFHGFDCAECILSLQTLRQVDVGHAWTIFGPCCHAEPQRIRLHDGNMNRAIADLLHGSGTKCGNVVVFKHTLLHNLPVSINRVTPLSIRRCEMALIEAFVKQWANGGPVPNEPLPSNTWVQSTAVA